MNYKRRILTGLFFCFFLSFISSFKGFTGKCKSNICPEILLVNSPQPDRLRADFRRPGVLLYSVRDSPFGKTVSREKRHKKLRKVEMLIADLPEGSQKNFFCNSTFHLPTGTRILSNEGLGLSSRGSPRA